ncbi:thiol:disulfide interchange protein [Leptolyngbya cf. ectocarpi LEGE 11479]|uniref:Thiol:disulfide interchange protein n=1 Tax=Leptolyngbya cf. ectocarpi LEGE 11479 TaxID=1828722 RepID=A0A928ZUR5_LEPEC|nr:thioredoxin domain-containing protein [Leptolyngbya ectocarpi]MBE9067828.1 thiol:disulfide interchange protein [Leptolyngbya cf. ectocarpi LEGE 11479]
MVSTTQEGSTNPLTKLVAVTIAVIAAILVTFLITRPAATATSFTPLSGLITLKSMATEAMPYEDAISSPNPTLIEFYADWCTTCQGMATTMVDLHQQYGATINFVMLDIDDPQWATQVSDYGASGVPQFTLLDAHQNEIKTWVGKVPKPVFAHVFDQLG